MGEWQVAWKERKTVVLNVKKMKTLRVWIVTAIVLLTFLSTATIAGTEPGRQDSSGKVAESDEARIIMARLEEINSIDKSALSSSEVKDLQKEVKALEKRRKQIGGGVVSSYFSGWIHRFTVAMRF